MRKFSARETEWMLELDGIDLANFRQRAFAFLIDWFFIVIMVSIVGTAIVSGYLTWQHHKGRTLDDVARSVSGGENINVNLGPALPKAGEVETPRQKLIHEINAVVNDVVLPVLYFGILTWRGKGRTPGKRLMKIRVVSIVHRHLTFWHSVERALGYGAAALELGFGFVQYFIHPYRRCAQDRLAETIVVTEAGYQAMQHKLSHPLVPDVG